MNHAILATYIWLDAEGNPRSKAKVMSKPVTDLSELGEWNFDGSSTKQAEGKFSDVFLHPQRIYKDPFRGGDNILVLCECWDDDNIPNAFNTRLALKKSIEMFGHLEPLAGIEQEYIIFDRKTNLPYGWKGHNQPGSGNQGPYHCGTGGNHAFGRFIADQHLKMCLQAGVHMFGINGESMPAQWEYQIGTVDPLTVADDAAIARYILQRITEDGNTYVSLHPKPYLGNWSGSGGHINFSTKAMRADGGLTYIEDAMQLLSQNHHECLRVYGQHNELRLTGEFVTESMDKFTWGIGDRRVSVRIPKQVAQDKKGYFEDRRPASNVDPYRAFNILLNIVAQLKD